MLATLVVLFFVSIVFDKLLVEFVNQVDDFLAAVWITDVVFVEPYFNL